MSYITVSSLGIKLDNVKAHFKTTHFELNKITMLQLVALGQHRTIFPDLLYLQNMLEKSTGKVLHINFNEISFINL